MYPADEIRAAARSLRERADKAELGLAAALHAGTRDLFGRATPDPAVMHPPVARALADWMDLFAATEYDPEAGIQETSRRHECALALARQINGGQP